MATQVFIAVMYKHSRNVTRHSRQNKTENGGGHSIPLALSLLLGEDQTTEGPGMLLSAESNH